MSSSNYYMRPQDREGGSNSVGRGYHQSSSRSRSRQRRGGRSRDRSLDIHDMRNHHDDQRDMNGEARRRRNGDQYYHHHHSNSRYRSYDDEPRASDHRYQASSSSRSRGRSRGSVDFDARRNGQRDMSGGEMRQKSSGYHQRSNNSSYYEPQRSQSCGPHSRYASSSTSRDDHNHRQEHDYSSHRRKRWRSPNPKTSAIQIAMEDLTNLATKFERRSHYASNKRRPLGSINGAEMQRTAPHPMTSNGQLKDNDATLSLGRNGVNNMSSHQNHHHQLQYHHYHHPVDASHQRRPLASSRQDSSCQPPHGQVRRMPAPQFNKINDIPTLIQTAYSSLSAFSLSPPNTAAFWNSLAKQLGRNNHLNLTHEKMGSHINQLFEHTRRTLGSFGPRDLSQTIYSMAKLVDLLRKRRSDINHRKDNIASSLSNLLLSDDATINKDLFLSLAIASVRNLSQFNAQSLSNLAYSYALMGYVPKFDDGSDLFDHIAVRTMAKHLRDFKPQEVSNMVWAFATVAKRHDALFKAMGDQAVAQDHLRDFKPQHLSNIVWAYATAQVSHPKLFKMVANHIVQLDHLREFRPQALSNIVWAYATAEVSHLELFKKVAEVATQRKEELNSQDIATILWAYATAQVSHPKMFQKVAKTAIQQKEELNSQDVANLLWSYATMGIIDKQLFSSFVPIAAQLIDSCNNQGLANIAWAYAVADVDAPTLFNDRFINKCLEKKDRFSVEDLRQLHQWHLWQTKEKSRTGFGPEALQDRCYKVFISKEPTPSKLQNDVVGQLSSIGLDPKEEMLMDSGYRIDALVEVNGKTIGVEVDGPSHFIGRSKAPLARTILKRRQVPSIDGIELVSVPYWEWDKLGKDQTKKQEYLQQLLGLRLDTN